MYVCWRNLLYNIFILARHVEFPRGMNFKFLNWIVLNLSIIDFIRMKQHSIIARKKDTCKPNLRVMDSNPELWHAVKNKKGGGGCITSQTMWEREKANVYAWKEEDTAYHIINFTSCGKLENLENFQY